MPTKLSSHSRPLVTLLVLMVLGGVALRFVDLGFPEELTWDEHHFVKNARNYLEGKPDWNDHPPLGKLFMAISIDVLGDDSFAFRLPSALIGSLGVLAAGALGRSLFQSPLAGLLAAAFIAVDGFFISYSRTALLDGMLATVSLTALWLMTLRGIWPILLAGCAIGCGMAIKMSAVVLFGPLIALAVVRAAPHVEAVRGAWGEASLFGRDLVAPKAELLAYVGAAGLAVGCYLAWWMVGLGITGQDHSVADAARATQKMMAGHAKGNTWTHPLLSKWWTWAQPEKPLMLSYKVGEDGMLRVMSTMGNPLIWWGAVGSMAFAIERSVSGLVARKLAAPLGLSLLLLTYVAYLSPWILTDRDSYIYHYLPPYGFGVVALGGVTARFATTARRESLLLLGVCCVAAVSAFYAPVWAKLPLSASALEQRPLLK